MNDTILLYGATGFSGRLIAAEGQYLGLAGRDLVNGRGRA